MKKDYDRTICNTCDIKERCERYCNESWCRVCRLSLMCLMDGNINNKQCHEMKKRWRTLPRKCVLVDEIMYKYLITNPYDTTNFCVNDYNIRICPRCLQATLITYPFEPPGTYCENSIINYSHFCASCSTCNVYIKQPVKWKINEKRLQSRNL